MSETLKHQPETIQFVKAYFEKKDDGNGYLNLDELRKCLQIVGSDPTDDDLQWMVDTFDKDKNGKLSIDELVENLDTVLAHSVSPAELKEAFEKFDVNGDGYIRLPELLKVLMEKDNMPEPEARKLLTDLWEEFDINRDGKFDYNEWSQIFLSNRYPFENKSQEQQQSKKF